MISEGKIFSVREVSRELEERFDKESGKIAMLTKANKDFFELPTRLLLLKR